MARQAAANRWTASGWLLVRRGAGLQLASGGTLGGSQIGGRIGYRLNDDAERPLSLVARFYAPLRDDGAEAALGIEWKPSPALPLRLLAERRQAIGEGGRNAFALLAYGGVNDRRVAGPVLLDAYAQAGAVGLRSNDGFVDGMASLSVPLRNRATAGAALWGAAQTRLSRLDIGPRLSWRPPIRANVRISAEWRFRIAGDSAPDSGPALTIGGDF